MCEQGKLYGRPSLVDLADDHSPMAPGSCYTTELKFLPLAKGPLHMEALRLVDIDSNETVDVRDLPDIIPIDREEEEEEEEE